MRTLGLVERSWFSARMDLHHMGEQRVFCVITLRGLYIKGKGNDT